MEVFKSDANVTNEGEKPTALRNSSAKNTDLAHQYTLDSINETETSISVDLHAIRRKLDWRILPALLCCHTVMFVDKGLLNFAAIMGLREQLGLVGNEFSNAASAVFYAYLIAEIPSAIILQKLAASKWLGANVVLWGIATACTAATNNYHSLLACRILTGLFEASIEPALTLVVGQWYTKSEQAPRFGILFCGPGLGLIIGSILSYAFQQVEHQAIAGWRIMFIVLGVVTIAVGIWTYLVVPKMPLEGGCLSEREHTAWFRHVSVNQTGFHNKNFKPSQLLEALRDPQLWLLAILTISILMSSGVISAYSATLIRSFGFSPPVSALLSIPGGIVAMAYSLLVGYGIRHTSNRWAWIVFCAASSVLGGALMSFLPSRNRGGLLVGIYLVNAIIASGTVIFQWTSCNVAGHTKRVAAMSLLGACFSVGSIIGPQTFRAEDAPQYTPAKITVLASQANGGLVATLLFLYYLWANKRKDAAVGRSLEDEDGSDPSLWDNLTDKENKSFRYLY